MNFIATYADSAFTGIGILDTACNVDDRVKVVAFRVDHYTRPTWHKIYCNSKGQYFIKYNHRYYLSEFLRCN